jgi:glutamyl-tRNA synthetase
VALYQAFGWQPPQFAHVGLLQDQFHQKLSKRKGDMLKDISTFREKMGIFPESLTNFVALLGWSHTKRKDAMTLDDLVNNVCPIQIFVVANA